MPFLTLILTLPIRPCKELYLADVIFDRTRVPAWYSWPPPRSGSIHRCTATAYSYVLRDCTETRCILCRRPENRQVDRRLETRSSALVANQRSTECHRRPCIASMSLHFRALYIQHKPKFDLKITHVYAGAILRQSRGQFLLNLSLTPKCFGYSSSL